MKRRDSSYRLRGALAPAVLLVACTRLVAVASADELVLVYQAPPGRIVTDVYAPPAKVPPELYVVDSSGELHHLKDLHGTPVDTLVATAPRWFVSRRSTSYGSAEVTVESDAAVRTHFVHRDELATSGTIDLDFAAGFLLSDDASTVVAVRDVPWSTRIRELRVFDTAGDGVAVPALAHLSGRHAAQLALAGDGSRLAADVGGTVFVYDLRDATAASPLFQLEDAARLVLAPSGRLLARIDFDLVAFHRDATELRRVATNGPAEVAFGADKVAAVMDAGQLQIVDLSTGILATHEIAAPVELRSVDAVGSGAATRIALTSIEETGSTAKCELVVFDVSGSGTVTRRTWERVETQRWGRRSPNVRLIGTGEHAFVSSLDRVWITGE